MRGWCEGGARVVCEGGARVVHELEVKNAVGDWHCVALRGVAWHCVALRGTASLIEPSSHLLRGGDAAHLEEARIVLDSGRDKAR